jgi:hypothetical protein
MQRRSSKSERRDFTYWTLGIQQIELFTTEWQDTIDIGIEC